MSIPQNENNSIELYMAAVCGKEVQLPEPRTRLELFFAKWAGMDVTLPVDYPEGIVTFEPMQEGSGVPTPENVRPILPGLTLERDDSTMLTVYGGTLDVLSGTLTEEWGIFDNLQSKQWSLNPSSYPFFRTVNVPLVDVPKRMESISNKYDCNTPSSYSDSNMTFGFISDGSELRIRDKRYEDVSTFVASLSDCVIAYPLATPQTYQLTSTEVARALEALGYYSINTRAEYCLLAAMKKVDPPSNPDSRFVNFIRWGLGVGEEPVGTYTRFERYLREWATQQLI